MVFCHSTRIVTKTSIKPSTKDNVIDELSLSNTVYNGTSRFSLYLYLSLYIKYIYIHIFSIFSLTGRNSLYEVLGYKKIFLCMYIMYNGQIKT